MVFKCKDIYNNIITKTHNTMAQIYIVSSAKYTYTERGIHTTPFPPMPFAEKARALNYIDSDMEMNEVTPGIKFESEDGTLISLQANGDGYYWEYELWTSEIL